MLPVDGKANDFANLSWRFALHWCLVDSTDPLEEPVS
jgi:hypothetical protein